MAVYVAYLPEGGGINIPTAPAGLPFYWFDSKAGHFSGEGVAATGGSFAAPDQKPWVLLIGKRTPQ